MIYWATDLGPDMSVYRPQLRDDLLASVWGICKSPSSHHRRLVMGIRRQLSGHHPTCPGDIRSSVRTFIQSWHDLCEIDPRLLPTMALAGTFDSTECWKVPLGGACQGDGLSYWRFTRSSSWGEGWRRGKHFGSAPVRQHGPQQLARRLAIRPAHRSGRPVASAPGPAPATSSPHSSLLRHHP
jgi:hypothetical protein